MPDWAIPIAQAVGRLMLAVAACEYPCAALEDCAAELADDLNNFAYVLEHKDN